MLRRIGIFMMVRASAAGSWSVLMAGLEAYCAYVTAAQADPTTYSADSLRCVMDAFRDVLFHHLRDEVASLGALSVHEAGFTLREIELCPM